MLEVRTWPEGRVELVSDDSNAENSIVSEALVGTEAGARWDETEMESGELVIEIKPEEFGDVCAALSGADYTWEAVQRLDELEAKRAKSG